MRGQGPSGATGLEPRAHLVAPVAAEQAHGADPTRPVVKGSVPKSVQMNEAALQTEYFGDLDARLALESRDPTWAASTEEKLRSSAIDVQPRINIDNTRCGQTMCRVEATVPDLQHEGLALEKFIISTGMLLPEAVVRDGDGPGRHVVYFARKGGEFPPMNAAPEGAMPR